MNLLNIVYPISFEILYGTTFLYFPINIDIYIVVAFLVPVTVSH